MTGSAVSAWRWGSDEGVGSGLRGSSFRKGVDGSAVSLFLSGLEGMMSMASDSVSAGRDMMVLVVSMRFFCFAGVSRRKRGLFVLLAFVDGFQCRKGSVFLLSFGTVRQGCGDVCQFLQEEHESGHDGVRVRGSSAVRNSPERVSLSRSIRTSLL